MQHAFWIQRLTVSGGLLAWLSLSVASAASVLEFPRLIVDGDTITGFALVNTSAGEAPVTLTAYGLDGQVLGVARLTAPPGSQVARLTSELFPHLPAGTNGWVRAVSEIDGLTGFFLFLSGNLREFDGADLPVRSRSLVFNQVRQGDGFSTEITLINSTNQPAAVEISLSAGGTAGAVVTELPARGGLRREVGQIFGLETLPDDGVIRVESDRDLVGFEVIRPEDGDLLALNARSRADRQNTLFFPQVAVQGGIRSRLGLLNYSGGDAEVRITFHRPRGGRYRDELQQNPVSLTLPAGGTASHDLAELFGAAGEQTIEGWLEVETDSPSLNGYLAYRVEPAGATAAVAPVAQGARRALFSHIATTRGFFTGIAALNPGRVAADLRIVALSRSGQRLGVFDTVLAPGARISRLLTDLIPGAAGQNGGAVWIRSNQPVFTSSLFGTNQGAVLSNIPPQSVLDGFEPDAGVARVEVVPSLVAVPLDGGMQFEAQGAVGEVQWSVQGVEGGTVDTGLIGSDGGYVAPAEVPSLPLVVTARSGETSGSATVDVIRGRNFDVLSGEITAIAYLFQRDRLVFARTIEGDEGSELVELGPDGQTTRLVTLAGERISALLPMKLSSREVLLAGGVSTGSIFRFDPEDNTTSTVATGLPARALEFDPLTGGLLVAEPDRLTLLARSPLESLPRTGSGHSKFATSSSTLLPEAGDLIGMAADQCNGAIFLTTAGGRLLRLERESGAAQPVVSVLQAQEAVEVLYRRGVACPEASHVLVSLDEPDPFGLHRLSGGVLGSWLGTNAEALTFLPAGNPYTQGAGLLVADRREDGVQLSFVDMQDLYRGFPVNPPQVRLEGGSTSPGPDLSLSNISTLPGGLAAMTVSYRPASGGQPGSEGLNVMAFSVSFDPQQFSLDVSDRDGNGIPDSIQSALPVDFTLIASAQPEAGKIDVVIADFSRPFSAIPGGDLLSFVLRVLPSQAGSLEVTLLDQPAASAANSQGQVRRFDEINAGVVFVQP